MVSILGNLAMISSLAIVIIGLPAQIWSNYKRKSTEGLSPFLIYAAVVTYTLWSSYAWCKPDWYMVRAYTPGCLLSLILLFQYFYYKKKKRR